MSRRYYIVKGKSHHHSDENHENSHHEEIKEPNVSENSKHTDVKDLDLPKEKEANDLMTAKGFDDYVHKHGYHFTEALSEHLSKNMKNSNGTVHTWTSLQVKKALESLGLQIPEHSTLGDLTYESNKAYAVLFPDVLKDETSCIKYAHKVAAYHSEHDGVVFSRWISDAINKEELVDWEDYI